MLHRYGLRDGLSVSHVISAATTNATIVKAAAGILVGWVIGNTNASARYVKIHDLATSPTAGTSTVFMTLGIPATSQVSVEFANGILMATGISYTTVTGIANDNSTAVGASDLSIDILYK